jgi:hypothetical protein
MIVVVFIFYNDERRYRLGVWDGLIADLKP